MTDRYKALTQRDVNCIKEEHMIDKNLQCEMKKGCPGLVTHIDVKGWVYCKECAVVRKHTVRCRQLKPKELKLLRADQPLEKY